MDAAKATYNAMQDLRAGRITADQYRAIMRELRSVAGSEDEWERSKFRAFAADVRARD
jgi:hypothetical protein